MSTPSITASSAIVVLTNSAAATPSQEAIPSVSPSTGTLEPTTNVVPQDTQNLPHPLSLDGAPAGFTSQQLNAVFNADDEEVLFHEEDAADEPNWHDEAPTQQSEYPGATPTIGAAESGLYDSAALAERMAAHNPVVIPGGWNSHPASINLNSPQNLSNNQSSATPPQFTPLTQVPEPFNNLNNLRGARLILTLEVIAGLSNQELNHLMQHAASQQLPPRDQRNGNMEFASSNGAPLQRSSNINSSGHVQLSLRHVNHIRGQHIGGQSSVSANPLAAPSPLPMQSLVLNTSGEGISIIRKNIEVVETPDGCVKKQSSLNELD